MTNQAQGWTSSLPADWSVERLRFLIDFIESGTSVNAIDFPAEDNQLGVLKTSAVYTRKFRPEENKTVVPEDRERVSCPLREGAIVVSRMNTPELVGAAGLVDKAPSNIYLPDRLWQVVVEQDHSCAGYLHWYMCSQIYSDQIRIACSGSSSSMQNLGQDQFRSFVSPKPPLQLQIAIASHLDAETARIDGLIEEKKKLKALLAELRSATITDAVMGRIDVVTGMARANAEGGGGVKTGRLNLQDSRVSWLGAVPAHWTPMRLRDSVEGCLNGIWGDEPRGDENDTPIIRVADFDRIQRRTFAHETVRNVGEEQRKSRELCHGDLLIEKSGGGEQQSVGMVVEYTGQAGAVCSNFVARMRPREGVNSRYLVYVHAHLYSRSVPTLSIKQSTGIQNLDSAAYLGEQLFLPPLDEQIAIASYLDAETARIDMLMAHVDREIELLNEFRSATITDAVLGRIDVRDYMKN